MRRCVVDSEKPRWLRGTLFAAFFAWALRSAARWFCWLFTLAALRKKVAAVTRSFIRLVYEFELLRRRVFTWCSWRRSAKPYYAVFKCNDFSNICLRKGSLKWGPSLFEALPLCSRYCSGSFSENLLAGCSSGGTFLAKAAERLGQNATWNAASTFDSSYWTHLDAFVVSMLDHAVPDYCIWSLFGTVLCLLLLFAVYCLLLLNVSRWLHSPRNKHCQDSFSQFDWSCADRCGQSFLQGQRPSHWTCSRCCAGLRLVLIGSN